MILNKINSDHSPADIVDEIVDALDDSRFSACLLPRRSNLKILEVRLRERKLYCGNHPKACEATGGPRHCARAYLEGADWVEFNDIVNDVLDRMGVDCFLTSAICIIRKGRLRRVHYDANTQLLDGNWAWDKDGPPAHYRDNCGSGRRVPASEFPYGTPGIHTRRNYYCVGAHDH